MSDKTFEWPDSLWKATAAPLQRIEPLSEDIDTDLLIIGAGYTGLSTALHAIDAAGNVVVIDQAQPGWGCSGRNGGHINPQWKTSVGRLQELYAGNKFDQFVDTLDETARLVFDLIDRYNIDCNPVRSGSVIPGKGERGRKYLAEWSQFWRHYGADVELLDAAATKDMTGTSIYDFCMFDRRGGSVQPLSYARGLAKACLGHGVSLFSETQALAVVRENNAWLVKTNKGQIRCHQVVIATNGYTGDLWPGLAQTIIPVASMLTATQPLSADIANSILPGRQAAAEYAGVPAYYRVDESNRLVFGWRGTLSGSIGRLDTSHLKSRAEKMFPALKSVEWEYNWAGYVGITSHQRPMLVKLGENAFAGLGYNGRGITMATMMGKQLAQALNQERSSISMQTLEKVPFHRCYPVGVTARIAYGHFGDYFGV